MPGSSPHPLPDTLSAEPFSVACATGYGVPASRLRRVDLRRPFYGVRSVAEVESIEERALAYQAWMRPDQFFSHETAAILWGLPLPLRLPQAALHVTTFSNQRSARGAGVVGHRTRRATRSLVREGLRVSDPVRTWLDLAGTLRLDELVAVGDSLVRPKFRSSDPEPLVPFDTLVEAVTRSPRIPGLCTLRSAAGLVRVGSASPAETHLRLAIQRHALPTPELNAKVYSRSRQYLGRGDFVFGDARVVVEYEGDHHRVDAATFRQDIRRRERFEDDGWRMVRATGDDLGRTRQQFLARLERLLNERSAGTGSSCAHDDRTRR